MVTKDFLIEEILALRKTHFEDARIKYCLHMEYGVSWSKLDEIFEELEQREKEN